MVKNSFIYNSTLLKSVNFGLSIGDQLEQLFHFQNDRRTGNSQSQITNLIKIHQREVENNKVSRLSWNYQLSVGLINLIGDINYPTKTLNCILGCLFYFMCKQLIFINIRR